MEIFDNFIDDLSHKAIEETLLGANFPWYFNNNKVGRKYQDHINNFQFTHAFYSEFSARSSYFSVIEPLLVKLNPSAIVRIKANLVPVTESIISYDLHNDFEFFDGLTAIYYVNSNNGHTFFEDGTIVNSVANRLVVFPANLKHSGTTCTDQKVRSVINFNYYIWKQ